MQHWDIQKGAGEHWCLASEYRLTIEGMWPVVRCSASGGAGRLLELSDSKV